MVMLPKTPASIQSRSDYGLPKLLYFFSAMTSPSLNPVCGEYSATTNLALPLALLTLMSGGKHSQPGGPYVNVLGIYF